jgi:hypothetical protein
MKQSTRKLRYEDEIDLPETEEIPSLDEINMLDFFAAFALMGYGDGYTPIGKAVMAYQTAKECLKQRQQ